MFVDVVTKTIHYDTHAVVKIVMVFVPSPRDYSSEAYVEQLNKDNTESNVHYCVHSTTATETE
jgi:hypothetical protein